MAKVHLLGANRSYDRDVQTVSINQIVVLEGYAGGSYVVYDITRDRYGFTYHLVHTSTYDFSTSDLIRPLSEKFGIGIYYDSENPTFLDPLETAALLAKAKEKKAEEERKAKEAREEHERISKIGAARLLPLIPSDAKAVIIGELRVSECASMLPILREQTIWPNITQTTNTVKITAWETVCIWAGTSTTVGRLVKNRFTALKNSWNGMRIRQGMKRTFV